MSLFRSLPQRGSSQLVPVVLGLLLALGAIAVFQKAMGWDEPCGRSWSRHVSTHGDTTEVTLRSGRCRLEAEIRGDVRFDATESAVAHVGPGGRLDIEHKLRADGETVEHRLTARPGPTPDAPEVVYRRDGDEQPFDAAARVWLHGVALELYRRVGVDAEARAGRIWDEGGTTALLAEVDAISSDHLATRYLAPVIRRGDARDLTAAFERARRRVGSDHALANFFVRLAEADRWSGLLADADADAVADAVADGNFARAAAETVAEIGSDYEQRRAVTALLASLPDDGSAADLEDALLSAVAGTMGSDFETAELMVTLAERQGKGAPLPPATVLVLDTIGSDYELRRALAALLERQPPDADVVTLVEVAERRIGSDYELAELLLEALDSLTAGDAVEDAVRGALDKIGSEHERNRVLRRLSR